MTESVKFPEPGSRWWDTEGDDGVITVVGRDKGYALAVVGTDQVIIQPGHFGARYVSVEDLPSPMNGRCPMDGQPLSRVVSEIGQPTEYYHRNGEWHYDRSVQMTNDVQWTTVENASWPAEEPRFRT